MRYGRDASKVGGHNCTGCGALGHFGSSPSQALMLVQIVQRTYRR